MERVVRTEIRCEQEADIVERTKKAFENRSFGWSQQSDGSVEFFGRLPAELAETLIAAIEANVDNNADRVPAGTAQEPCNRCGGLNKNPKTISVGAASAAIGLFKIQRLIAAEAAPTTGHLICSCFNTASAKTFNEVKTIDQETVDTRPPIAARRADASVTLCESHCKGYEVTVHVPAETV